MTLQSSVQKNNSFFILDYIALSGSFAISLVFILGTPLFLFEIIKAALL